jgi:hypothetical protein
VVSLALHSSVDDAEKAAIEVLASLSIDLGRRHGAVEPLDDPGRGEAIHDPRIDPDRDLGVRALLDEERRLCPEWSTSFQARSQARRRSQPMKTR